RIAEIAALAAAHGTRMHLDAARLLLAPPALDRKAYVAPFETVYVSLYKYLGAPFGAVLAGPAATIARA
ncbi:beta-eliminating lyase-related protein, partial [Escherichia coli]|uniref:beta-eliminating lyase-related protein n=2 Tax=Pseudomonadota TaxID=1224 RepID=UPI00202DE6FA